MSGDGYGDQLSAYEAWLHARAHQMVPGTRLSPSGDDHDDLVQHGLIAMWRALASYDPDKGALPAWLTMKANGAMKDTLRPAPTKHGRESSLEALLELPDDLTPEALLSYPDMLEGVVRAYHAGEVARALATLTPKQMEYVRLRFWEGKQKSALIAHFGYDPSGLWNSPKNGAKHKLRRALQHLAA